MSSQAFRWLTPAVAAGSWLLAGCYTTTLQSGLAPAAPTIEYDGKWHSGVVLGIAELSGPYDLQKVCPQGWAEIKTETSFVNGIVELVTTGIYSPQTVTIRCSASTAPARPATAVQ
jgi:hypothetical protein